MGMHNATKQTCEAGERVKRWDAIWRNYIAALRMGRPELIEVAQRQIEAFDAETGAHSLRCTSK